MGRKRKEGTASGQTISGLRLQECRKEKGFSQQRLSELAHVSQQLISAMENGSVTKSAALDCAPVLGVTVGYLMGKSPYKTEAEMRAAHAEISKNLFAIENAVLCSGGWLIPSDEASDTCAYLIEENGVIKEYPKSKIDAFSDEIMDFIMWKYLRLRSRGKEVSEEKLDRILATANIQQDMPLRKGYIAAAKEYIEKRKSEKAPKP